MRASRAELKSSGAGRDVSPAAVLKSALRWRCILEPGSGSWEGHARASVLLSTGQARDLRLEYRDVESIPDVTTIVDVLAE